MYTSRFVRMSSECILLDLCACRVNVHFSICAHVAGMYTSRFVQVSSECTLLDLYTWYPKRRCPNQPAQGSDSAVAPNLCCPDLGHHTDNKDQKPHLYRKAGLAQTTSVCRAKLYLALLLGRGMSNLIFSIWRPSTWLTSGIEL